MNSSRCRVTTVGWHSLALIILQVAGVEAAVAAMKDLAQSHLQLSPGSGAVITNGRIVWDSNPAEVTASPGTASRYISANVVHLKASIPWTAVTLAHLAFVS